MNRRTRSLRHEEGRAELPRLVEFPLESGGSVIVEVPDGPGPAGGEVTRGFRPANLTVEAGETFEGAFSRIQPVAAAVVAKLREVADAPDEIEVEFGVQLSADVGAIVAKVSGEANFKVVLRWTSR